MKRQLIACAEWWRWDQDPAVWVSWALDNAGQSVTVQRGVATLHAWVRDGYRGEALTVGHVGQLLVFAK